MYFIAVSAQPYEICAAPIAPIFGLEDVPARPPLVCLPA